MSAERQVVQLTLEYDEAAILVALVAIGVATLEDMPQQNIQPVGPMPFDFFDHTIHERLSAKLFAVRDTLHMGIDVIKLR
jgi:hypothetical protein